MIEPDKYRLKAREVVDYWWETSPDKRSYLEDQVAAALAESAREAMERAAKIAESARTKGELLNIAEAIRKEMP